MVFRLTGDDTQIYLTKDKESVRAEPGALVPCLLYTSVNSGKVLDVYGASASNGAVLQQYDSTGTVAQQWTVRNYGDGKISLMSVNANKAIDCLLYTSSLVRLRSRSSNSSAAWLSARLRCRFGKTRRLRRSQCAGHVR